MQKFTRLLNLSSYLNKSSLFLFGPRGTGKSFLIREIVPQIPKIDLLRSKEFLRFSKDPSLLESIVELRPNDKMMVIDEIQKLPILLDEVHRLIEEKGIHFLLTGSSARKLKRNQANLLAGRARSLKLHPLCFKEIPQFYLESYLLWGGLPAVQHLELEDRPLFFESYVETYLKEEILMEQVTRKLPHFSRFLTTAALCSGEMINYTKIANDAQCPVSTTKNYFEALEDTLIATTLDPWVESKKRKAIMTSKFYFFDIGVVHHLLNIQTLREGSTDYGRAFEHFIFMELKAFQSYHHLQLQLYYWRSVNHQEVDFILGPLAIEVKSTSKSNINDAKNLFALREEEVFGHYIVVSRDVISYKKNGILFLHWNEFLEKLWSIKKIEDFSVNFQ